MWTRLFSNRPTFSLVTGGTAAVPGRRLHLFEILAPAAGILSLGDAILTQYMVSIGRVQEGNPLMARLLADNQFLWVKIIGTLLGLGLLWKVSRRFPRLAGAAALFIMVFYCGVLLWNSSVMAGA